MFQEVVGTGIVFDATMHRITDAIRDAAAHRKRLFDSVRSLGRKCFPDGLAGPRNFYELVNVADFYNRPIEMIGAVQDGSDEPVSEESSRCVLEMPQIVAEKTAASLYEFGTEDGGSNLRQEDGSCQIAHDFFRCAADYLAERARTLDFMTPMSLKTVIRPPMSKSGEPVTEVDAQQALSSFIVNVGAYCAAMAQYYLTGKGKKHCSGEEYAERFVTLEYWIENSVMNPMMSAMRHPVVTPSAEVPTANNDDPTPVVPDNLVEYPESVILDDPDDDDADLDFGTINRQLLTVLEPATAEPSGNDESESDGFPL